MTDTHFNRDGSTSEMINPASVNEALATLISLLASQSDQARNSQTTHFSETKTEALKIMEMLAGSHRSQLDCHPMTPVNSILGNGTLGRYLNGKKTAIGIVGLLATHLLPVLFPGAAPILTTLESIGLEQIASDPEAGTKILTSIFAGFTAWGGLGKLEKWILGLDRNLTESDQV